MGRPTNAMLAERKRLAEEQGTIVEPIPALRNATLFRRYTLADLDAWMLSRLNYQWPGIAEPIWRGKIMQLSSANHCLFATNDEVVGLFYAEGDILTGKQIVRERFVWSRTARQTRDGDWVTHDEAPMFDLYRYARSWAKSMQAAQLLEVCRCSDIAPGTFRRVLGGEYTVYLNAA